MLRWVVLPFPDSLPTFEYSPSRGKSPLCQQNDHFPRGFRVLVYQSSGPPRGSHTRLQSVPYTAAMEVLSQRAPRTVDFLPPQPSERNQSEI